MSEARTHTHLDGTEHSGTPTAVLPTPAPPRGPAPGLVDGRMLFVALLVCSPAAYRLAQGMVSLTDVLTRYLVVAIGCVALAAVVRVVWPILSGDLPAGSPASLTPAASRAARPGTDPAVQQGTDDLFADEPGAFGEDAASLLASGVDYDHLELSSLPD